MSSAGTFDVGGRTVHIHQETAYPLDGIVNITVEGTAGLTVGVRIPGWCRHYTITKNGEPVVYSMKNGYSIIPCNSSHTQLVLDMDMTPEFMEASPLVHADAGRAALKRGPVVYCVEGVDNSGKVHDLLVDAALKPELIRYPDFPLPAIQTPGWRVKPSKAGQLYRQLLSELESCKLTYIPYFTFANRGNSDMLVWVPVKR
jgi:DUF1680 family protein